MFAGIAAGLAAGALWGLVFVAPRMVAEFGSVNLTAGRFIVYGVVAVAAMAAAGRRVRWPTWAQAGGALWLSVLGFSGYYLVLVLAIRDAGSAMEQVSRLKAQVARDAQRLAMEQQIMDELVVERTDVPVQEWGVEDVGN